MYGRRCIDLVWWMETAAQRGVHTPSLSRATRSAVASSRCCRSASSSSAARRPAFRRCCSTCSPAWARGTSRSARPGSPSPTRWCCRAGSTPPTSCTGAGSSTWSSRTARAKPRSSTWCAPSTPPARHAGGAAGRTVASPITYEMLLAIVDQWTEAAMALTDRDLRLMERLARAQVRWPGRRRGGRGRGDQTPRTRHRLGRGALGPHRLGRRAHRHHRVGAAELTQRRLRLRPPHSQRDNMARSWAREYGLDRWASIPASSARRRSSSNAFAVRAMIGRRVRPCSCSRSRMCAWRCSRP